ncbi:MAG: response regulator [Pirellulales bacterium]|nr:response regulator [Pirellulales bacterium]
MTDLLIVDDDQDFAGTLRMMLQSRGYDVAMEHDTNNILARLDQRLPDALILDVMFPEDPFAGFELAREIRRRFPKLPILMLTGVRQQFSLEDEAHDPARLPVTDFVEKPVDFQEFSTKLDRLLGRPTIYTERGP